MQSDDWALGVAPEKWSWACARNMPWSFFTCPGGMRSMQSCPNGGLCFPYDASPGAPHQPVYEGEGEGMGWGIDPMVFGTGNRSVVCREPTWEEFLTAFEGTLFL